MQAGDMAWNDTDAMRRDMEGCDNDMKWNDNDTMTHHRPPVVCPAARPGLGRAAPMLGLGGSH